jgi:MFS family permease
MNAYTFTDVIQLSLFDLWARLIGVLPNIIGAIVVFLLGLLIAPILGGIVKKFFDIIRIDDLAEKSGIKEVTSDYTKNFSISLLIGKLVKWFFIIAFVMAAAEILGWTRVTEFLNEIIFYIPQVLVAIVILVLAVIAGNFFDTLVTRSLIGTKTPVDNPQLLGKITKWAFVLFGLLAAMLQVGIAPSLIQILFAGIVLALALAFGLGGREKASEILNHISIPPVPKKTKK